LGTASYRIHSIGGHAPMVPPILVRGISIQGLTSENDGKLNMSAKYLVDSVALDKDRYGPFRFKLSVDNIDATGFQSFVKFAKEQAKDGSMETLTPAESKQFQAKAAALFVNMITPGTSVSIDEIYAKLPQGEARLHAKVNWPADIKMEQGNIPVIMMSAHVQANVHASKALVEQGLQLLIGSPYFKKSEQPPAISNEVVEKLPGHMPKLMLNQMVKAKKLNKAAANHLIMLQDNRVSVKDYAASLKTLVKNKKISLEVAHSLELQYQQSKEPKKVILVKEKKLTSEEKIKLIKADLLKQGIIKETPADYSIDVSWKGGKLTVNGRPVSDFHIPEGLHD
jgi:uncharacterized protein YdgA (DUF945 family)